MDQQQQPADTEEQWWTEEAARQEAIGDFVIRNGLGVQGLPDNPYEEDSEDDLAKDEPTKPPGG